MAKRLPLLFFCLLLNLGCLTAQTLDSLFSWMDQFQNDSLSYAVELGEKAYQLAKAENLKVKELKALGFLTKAYFNLRDFKACEQYADLAIPLAQQLNDNQSLSRAYFYKSYCFMETARLEEGMSWLLKARTAAVQAGGDIKDMIRILSGIGFWGGQMGNFEEAFQYIQEALDLTTPDSLAYFRGYLLTLMSTTSMLKGDYNRALEFETRSLLASASIGDSMRMVISRHNLCDIYLNLGDYVKALEESKVLEQNAQFMSDERIMAGFRARMGLINFQMEEYELSQKNFEAAIEIYTRNSDPGAVAYTVSSMTPLLIHLEAYEHANDLLSRSIETMALAKDTINLILCKAALAEVQDAQGNHEIAQKSFLDCITYYDQQQIINRTADISNKLARSYQRTGNLDEALHHVQKALKNYEQANMNIGKADALGLQYELFKAKGDIASALESHEAYYAYTDSIRTEIAQRRLMEERVRENIEGLQEEKEAVESHNSALTSRNRLLVVLIALATLTLIGFIWFYVRLRKARNRLRTQKEQLEGLNQTRDRFFGIIAHDIRSPIIALQGVGMQMDYFLEQNNPNQLKRVAQSVDTTAKRLNRLLDNLLSWALSQTGRFPYHPAPVNPHKLVTETLENFQVATETKALELKYNVPSDIVLFVDENAARTILRNLIGNAVKFTPKGGVIEISCIAQKQWAEFRVKDTGIGISPEGIASLFKLSRISRKGTSGEKGTGLGLILCKELIDLHNGEISVESNIGQGTTFIFTLPLSPIESN